MRERQSSVASRKSLVIVATAARAQTAAAAPQAGAGRMGQPPASNLQILPKDMPRDQLTTTSDKGLDAAVAQFRDLRSRYYGAMAYDFTENGLMAVAQESSRTFVVMAQAHQRKNDKASAIKDLGKALELDPNNAQAKLQLEQLKGL
jgi:hypothetical protein